MTHDPYDYHNRDDIAPISWVDFHALCKGLARAVSPYAPQLILPVGRGGYYPGTLIAHILRVDIYPIRLSRRVVDDVVHREPRWLIAPPEAVVGRRVLVVDEISSTGQTLTVARERLVAMGARAVRGAVLYAHSHGATVPDYIGLISDALIINPWDREILANGRFQIHPEYLQALAQQGIDVDPASLEVAPQVEIAKGGP